MRSFLQSLLQASVLDGAKNFVFKVSFKDSAKMELEKSLTQTIGSSGNGLEAHKDLVLQRMNVRIEGIPVYKCLEIKYMCIAVIRGTNATYMDGDYSNNEICKRTIPVDHGGAGLLQCPFRELKLNNCLFV